MGEIAKLEEIAKIAKIYDFVVDNFPTDLNAILMRLNELSTDEYKRSGVTDKLRYQQYTTFGIFVHGLRYQQYRQIIEFYVGDGIWWCDGINTSCYFECKVEGVAGDDEKSYSKFQLKMAT